MTDEPCLDEKAIKAAKAFAPRARDLARRLAPVLGASEDMVFKAMMQHSLTECNRQARRAVTMGEILWREVWAFEHDIIAEGVSHTVRIFRELDKEPH